MGEMRHVLATIFNATLNSGDSNDWHEVHELRYLFRGNTRVDGDAGSQTC
jgi:hypothetical protein